MDISNRSLAFLLVVAIVVSLGGTMISLNRLNQLGFTGMASSNTPQGTANLSINSSLVLTFLTNNVDFGVGYTNDSGAGVEQCIIDTNGTNPSGDCVGFNSNVQPFELRNDGNKDLTVQISSDKNAASFLGGTSPVFQYFIEDNTSESGSCTTPSPTSWTNVPTTGTDMCGSTGFNYEDTTDQLLIHVKVSIPQDTIPNTKTATITVSGSDV